ncbi:transporter substrate-binding domain-containing protein [Hansschlegelia plantiphila]|uniref:transporter substrate-binding domain-containing protein n=1 Tax=Hansschlegelia plantiphila TaxID=374655 RepID=UPI0022F24854|nr:transporter substrate-binding domain-containing protein [Hansschlegelia plantiphila]
MRKTTQAPWKVGVLFSQTGCTADIERTQLHGTLMAIEEINAAGGVRGREIRPIVYDPGAGSVPYAYLAKKLIVEDGATSIFGCYTSASRKAIIPVMERLNGLLWYPTPYEGFEYSPNVIYTGAVPNQNSSELCRFMMQTYGPRFYLIGSDYVYPRRSNRLVREFLAGAGGSVVGERYVGIRARRQDFTPIMRDIEDVGADVIFSTVVGEGTSFLYQAYADAGFDPTRMPIASLTTTEAEIEAMGFDVGEAHITAACYFAGIESPSNTAFVNGFKKRFGEASTNACAEAAYFQVHLFARALEKTNSLATDDLRPLVLGSTFDAPQGRVRINPASGHTDLWTRIGRANRRGQFTLLREVRTPVQADPFMICAEPAQLKA